VLPDLQGPLDTAEMLRGSDIFLDLHDRPDDVRKLLSTVTTATISFARHLAPLMNDEPEGFCHQHAVLLPGAFLVRGDTAIMISPGMYREHVAPHDARLLSESGGGGMHSCGDFSRLVPEYLALPGIRCLDFGQSELNDLDAIYAMARRTRTALVRVRVQDHELETGAVLNRFPTGVVLKQSVASLAKARELLAAYEKAAHSRRERRPECEYVTP
jgi:hypothetical protein